MALVRAFYLHEVIGSVSELEVKELVVYSPKLDKNILLTAEMYEELDREELKAEENNEELREFTLNAVGQYFEMMKQKEKEKSV